MRNRGRNEAGVKRGAESLGFKFTLGKMEFVKFQTFIVLKSSYLSENHRKHLNFLAQCSLTLFKYLNYVKSKLKHQII